MRTDYFDGLLSPACPATQNQSGAAANLHRHGVTPLAPPALAEQGEVEKNTWPAELSPLLRRISAAQGWTREEAQDFRQHARRSPEGIDDARACLSRAKLPDPALLERRRRVRDMLANNTTLTMTYLVDNADTDPVVLTLAIRGKGTIELGIPREQFDALGLPGLIGELAAKQQA